LDSTVRAFFIRTFLCRWYAAPIVLVLRNGRFHEPIKIVSKDKKWSLIFFVMWYDIQICFRGGHVKPT